MLPDLLMEMGVEELEEYYQRRYEQVVINFEETLLRFKHEEWDAWYLNLPDYDFPAPPPECPIPF